MKKRRWVRLSIFLILILVVILIGRLAAKHWNSLEALLDSFRYSQDQVVEKLDENKKELQQFIDENENITVRDLTDEEAELLNKGEITEEEVVDILLGKTSVIQTPSEKPDVKPEKSDVKPEDSDIKQEETQDSADIVVSQAIAKLYIQKSKYLGKLDEIESKVRQEYIALVKSSTMTTEEKKAAKQRFLSSNLSMVAAWEKECDATVYGILDEIKVALKNAKQDTAIVKKLEEAYLNEKRLKKSYFINRYMD